MSDKPPIPEDWEIVRDVECVVCPGCAFTFDSVHTDTDGSYSCPCCDERHPSRAEIASLQAEVERYRETLKQGAAFLAWQGEHGSLEDGGPDHPDTFCIRFSVEEVNHADTEWERLTDLYRRALSQEGE